MDSLFLCHPQIVLCGSHNTVGIWIPYLPFENRKHIVKDARMKRRQLSMFDRQLDRHGLHFKWSVVRVWVFWIRSSSPFPAIWLGRDVRGECSTKTMGMIEFGYAVLIRGSVHMSILLYVHRKREAICALRLPVTGQGPPLTNCITYPLYFTPYIICERGRGIGFKKPRPILLILHFCQTSVCIGPVCLLKHNIPCFVRA